MENSDDQTKEENNVEKMPRSKNLTLEERKKIKHLLDHQLSWTQIGDMMNRSKFTIRNEVQRNGGSLNYDPFKANQISILKKRGRIENLQALYRNPVVKKEHLQKMCEWKINFETKLDTIITQIDILFEIIQEKK